ncbi:PTS galactitol transporter subunit IIA, partial [Escherichia coli]|nr:PTS galactitol transporter subunit IIA [Escherichia coli]
GCNPAYSKSIHTWLRFGEIMRGSLSAKSSAIYLLRPTNKVHFQQADDDNDVEVSLVIALIVENPQQQLKLLRCLFGKLQQPDIVETLITLPETKLKEYFTKYVLDSDE